MHLTRFFTDGLDNPYADLDFVERRSVTRYLDGSVRSERIILAPAGWSQVAVDILAQKYMRRAGVPLSTQPTDDGTELPEWLRPRVEIPGSEVGEETDARDVFHRLAGCWTYWAWKAGHFTDELFTGREAQAQIFYDELLYMLSHQMAAPNSPQWFNTGLHWAYGITRPPQGHWFVPDEGGAAKKSPDAYSRPQPHACFIQSIDDDLVNPGGIMDLWTREARIFKYGSGTGSNFSSLRGTGEPLSGGGRSSGLITFLKIGDVSAGAIKSGGTTRRAAKMVIVDIDHPDIESFINWKVGEENKVGALVAGSRLLSKTLKRIHQASDDELDDAVLEALDGGVPDGLVKRAIDARSTGAVLPPIEPMGLGFEDEAYLTVSGQNSNNSVRVSDAFMEAVENGEVWQLIRRTDGAVSEEISAAALWDQIVNAAWACADPGLQFGDTINRWHTCPGEGEIRGSNPCAEYLFLDDTACNLASLNLVRLLMPDGYPEDRLDLRAFEYAIRLWTRVLDVSVSMAQLPSREIAIRTHKTRTLGLGFANLGALLMRMGLPYDSPLGRDVAASIASMMGGTSYLESSLMASEIAPYPAYQDNAESARAVLGMHLGRAEELMANVQHPQALVLASRAVTRWEEACKHSAASGLRNAQLTLLAPTGTIALVMDCDTTGIEPDFALIKLKKLAGGGYFRIVNESVRPALQRMGYEDEHVDEIVLKLRGTGKLPGDLRERVMATLPPSSVGRLEESLQTAPSLDVALHSLAPEDRELLGLKDGLPILDQLVTHAGRRRVLNDEICGLMALDGLIDDKDLPVFDCSVPCGDSERSIAWQGHITMMAAVQPFLSGGISKTVNMPASSSPEDVSAAYQMAWRMGIKCIALYRDGCKLSQPLSTSLRTGRQRQAEALKIATEAAFGPAQPVGRRRMPNTRRGITQRIDIGGQKLYIRTGEYDDGALGEVFIDLPGEGSTMRAILNQFAIAVSVALQYGVPLEHLVRIFAFSKFEPSGRVAHHPRMMRANSIIDAVFRHLGWLYDGRDDLMHIETDDDDDLREQLRGRGDLPAPLRLDEIKAAMSFPDLPPPKSSEVPTFDPKSMGYTGDVCDNCGSVRMIRAGTCGYCLDCQTSTGCS